jgi:hypothetical protein
MKAILVDCSEKKEKNNGTINILKIKDYEKLVSLPYGEERKIFFLNTKNEEFTVIYDIKKKMCIIPYKCFNFLKEICQIPDISIFYTEIPVDDYKLSEYFLKEGFRNPYIVKENLVLTRDCQIISGICKTSLDIKSVRNKINFLITKQHKSPNCFITVKITPITLKKLKEMSEGVKSTNSRVNPQNGRVNPQTEMTGELILKEVQKDVFILDLEMASVSSGSEENVDVDPVRYNFHSHPKEAYIRHSVHKAWPSQTDFLGFFQLGKNTIFHIVATLEGLYIISFSKFWGDNLRKIDKNFIRNNYDINHALRMTPEEFANKVNNINYKGKGNIFDLKFFNWKDAGKEFTVFYPSHNKTCLVSQESVEKYKNFYK